MSQIKIQPSQVIEKLRDKLPTDTAIQTYVTAAFGAGEKAQIIVGMDQKNPAPKQIPFPQICILGIQSSEIKVDSSYKITLGYMVKKEELISTDNKHEYTGLLLAEKLREVTEGAIIKILKGFGRIWFDSESIETDNYPLWATATVIRIDKPISKQGS